MADILLDVQGAPIAPAAGEALLFVDTVSKKLASKNDVGFIQGRIENFSTAAQVIPAAARTYLTGSALAVPSNKLQIGTCFSWVFDIVKTAAGIAASTFDIAVGILGTTGDVARVSFTKPAGTAVVDNERIVIEAICRGPLSAVGIFAGHFQLTHNLQITGHAIIPCINATTLSAGFDVTVANLIVGICATTGAADAITIQLMQAQAWNL